MSDENAPKKKPKQSPSVKLGLRFHKRLKIVADDLGYDLGELIEERMSDFVNAEAKRIAGDLLSDDQSDRPEG